MSDLRKFFRLYFLEQRSFREISSMLSIPSSTLYDYAKRLKGLSFSEEDIRGLSDKELHSFLFPGRYEHRARLELPDFKKIHLELARKGVTLRLLHQEYSASVSPCYSYSCFCALYRNWRRASKLSMRQYHRPGEKLFIDFAGQTMGITNRDTGEVSSHPLYVCSLGFSSYTYCKLIESQSTPHFCAAVADSLTFYGGVPNLLVPDNLKAAVIKASFYDPQFNLVFKELSSYYGTDILPARVRKPQDKSKVEISVSVVERWILAVLRDQVFYSLEEANLKIQELLSIVNNRIMRDYGKSRRALFEEYEVSELKALPQEAYIPRTLLSCKVKSDYHVMYNRRYYSVPYEYINKIVTIEVTNQCINVFYRNNLIATHLKVVDIYGKSTNKEHMPVSHQKANEFNIITEYGLIIRGGKVGANTSDLIRHILSDRTDNRYKKRRCLGILLSAERVDVEEAELAAAFMLRLRDYHVDIYRNILKNKSYLIKGLQSDIGSAEMKSELHDNVRGQEAFL